MANARDWAWMTGILHGVGEAAWQQSNDGKVRRLTKCVTRHPSGKGIGLTRAFFPEMSAEGEDVEFDANTLVILATPCKDSNAKDLTMMWSGLHLG